MRAPIFQLLVSLLTFGRTPTDRVLTLNVQRVFTLTQKLTPLLEASRGDSKEGPWADPGAFCPTLIFSQRQP